MKTYFQNLWLWISGFTKFGGVDFKEGWDNGPLWWFVYFLDYGVNVLTGGAVEPISTRAQKHRSGVLWDKLLDVIETWDRGHGKKSGPALWGSKESPKGVQIVTTLLFLGLVGWGLYNLTLSIMARMI